jgi:hypothetical protein
MHSTVSASNVLARILLDCRVDTGIDRSEAQHMLGIHSVTSITRETRLTPSLCACMQNRQQQGLASLQNEPTERGISR